MIKLQKRNIALFVVVFLISALAIQTVFAATPAIRLPTSPVTATYGDWMAGSTSSVEITLSNVGTGFDVANGVYPGWCVERQITGALDGESAMLYSTYDPNMPDDAKPFPWNGINYLLNHKQGNLQNIQDAIWFLMENPTTTDPGSVDPAVRSMIEGAYANSTFEPAPGEIVAVIVYSDGIGLDPNATQETIIEVTVPDLDFGDLPNNYGMTTLAQDGARHLPGNIFLGLTEDAESDGTPTADASGDNQVGADEDGVQVVANPPNYWTQGQGTVNVTVSGGMGCLFGWMDVWNSGTNAPGTDGDFADSGAGWSEAIIVNQPVNVGSQDVNFALPVGAAKYPVWARFRLAPAVDGSCATYDTNPVTTNGLINNGEVEDYMFSFNPTAVRLESFSAQASGANRSMISLVAVVLAAGGLLLGRRWLMGRQLR